MDDMVTRSIRKLAGHIVELTARVDELTARLDKLTAPIDANQPDRKRRRSYYSPAHKAFGEWNSLLGWSRDPRCVVAYGALVQRVNLLGWPLETAMTTPTLNSLRNGFKK